jgi:hypothetical protein
MGGHGWAPATAWQALQAPKGGAGSANSSVACSTCLVCTEAPARQPQQQAGPHLLRGPSCCPRSDVAHGCGAATMPLMASSATMSEGSDSASMMSASQNSAPTSLPPAACEAAAAAMGGCSAH